MPALNDYLAALERLKKNQPERVPTGSKINKDTVALEAGRKRGSIKNRPGFKTLIEAIESESQALDDPLKKLRHSVDSKKKQIETLQSRIENLANQNLMLMAENHRLSKLAMNDKAAKVVAISSNRRQKGN